MTSPARLTAVRRNGIVAAFAVALGLALAPVIRLPPVTAMPASAVVDSRDDGSPLAPATSGACSDDAGRDNEPAEIGTAVNVDGIGVQLDGAAELGLNTLTATVGGKDDGPLSGAFVYLTIRMPTMDHGASAYPAAEIDPGRYRAEDISLGMGGDWLVTVEVVRQARAPISAAYVVAVAG